MVDDTETQPNGLLNVESASFQYVPLTNRLAWLRSAVSNFVQGGSYLLAGEAGIGKSTLALQIALDLGLSGARTIYMHTEQSASELKNRALLLSSQLSDEERDKALTNIQPVDWHYDLSQLSTFLAREVLSRSGRYADAQLIILDSIQGQGLSSAATRQFTHIYKFCSDAKAGGIATLLIGHVTKRGGIAGPKTLEHNVDCILYFRKAFRYRESLRPGTLQADSP